MLKRSCSNLMLTALAMMALLPALAGFAPQVVICEHGDGQAHIAINHAAEDTCCDHDHPHAVENVSVETVCNDADHQHSDHAACGGHELTDDLSGGESGGPCEPEPCDDSLLDIELATAPPTASVQMPAAPLLAILPNLCELELALQSRFSTSIEDRTHPPTNQAVVMCTILLI